MNKKIVSAAAASIVFFSAAASSFAYSLYSEGKSAAGVSEGYSTELTRLNLELCEAVKTYSLNSSKTVESTKEAATSTAEETGSAEADPEPQPTEESPNAAEIYSELVALAQEYHSVTAKTGRELAGKLMDYDVALKRLKILINRYKSRWEYADKLDKLSLTGDCDTKTAQSAKDDADGLLFDIKALLFDISVMKSEIESYTGETLTDDFDFNVVYLITDALKLDPDSFFDRSQLGSLYVPEGAALAEYEAVDCTSQLNDSVKAYYSLGAAMREFISAAAAEKEGKHSRLLGEMTSEELQKLTEVREDCFLSAAKAKAEFSKALLALDEASGRSVSGTVISGQEAAILCDTLHESSKGAGMWLVLRTSDCTVFLPVLYPAGTYPVDEDDKARYSYTISYDGKKIDSAACGDSCRITEIQYRDGLNYAEVVFYRNGVSVGTYCVSIFTPYGEFE